jgi:hypothetical protein
LLRRAALLVASGLDLPPALHGLEHLHEGCSRRRWNPMSGNRSSGEAARLREERRDHVVIELRRTFDSTPLELREGVTSR